MSATKDTPPRDTQGRSGSGTCRALLDAATPEMFRGNAFRITGLPVDATMREISKHADRLKIMEELGHGVTAHTFAFALNPPPTVDQIREAIQKLKDPEQRMVDEFFWFWPAQFGKSAHDPAIQALAGGDRETALEIWTLKETSPTERIAAMHNVAVLWHLVALEWEEYTGRDEVDEDRRRKIERYWRDAFKRWEQLTTDDLFWDTVSQRVTQLDDPRLTTGFVRRMRATLPQALNKINAELAISHARHGRLELARLHVQFMRETNQGLNDVEKTAELVLAPATTRLRQQILRAQDQSRSNPADAGQAVIELLKHAESSVGLFDLIAGPNNESRNDLFDEVAQVGCVLLVTYRKATEDAALCLTAGSALRKLATCAAVRRQIEENYSAWREMVGSQNLEKVAEKALEPLHAILKEIQNSGEKPVLQLNRFKSDAIPAIAKLSNPITGSKAHEALLNSAAIVLREISLNAWNGYQDISTARAANTLAIHYAGDPHIKQLLSGENKTLFEIKTQQPIAAATQHKAAKKSSAGCLIVLLVGGLVAFIASLHSNETSSNRFSSTPRVATPSRYSAAASTYNAPSTLATQPTNTTPVSSSGHKKEDIVIAAPTFTAFTAPVSYSTGDNGTSSVPASATLELNKDKQAIEYQKSKTSELEFKLRGAAESVDIAKARADDWQKNLDDSGAGIERARRYLDHTSQASVDDFNGLVSQHNKDIAFLKALNKAANDQVDAHNALLNEVRAQNRTVNQLVDAYNTKLRRN